MAYGLWLLADLHAGRVVLPAAAEGGHQRDAGVEFARAQIDGQAALVDHLTLGVQHHDLAGETCLVSLHRKFIGTLGLGERFALQLLLAFERLH